MKKVEQYKLPLNLQFFSEETDEPPAEPPQEPPVEPTFDEILKDGKHQSEFDRRVTKALETARTKWEQDYQQKLEDAKTEAEKLAKMNADQKTEYEKKKREDELTKRETEITRRELRASALESLAEKGLPKELADILSYSDAQSTKESLETVEKAFRRSVENGVNERLKGSPPKNGGGGERDNDPFLAKLAKYK